MDSSLYLVSLEGCYIPNLQIQTNKSADSKSPNSVIVTQRLFLPRISLMFSENGNRSIYIFSIKMGINFVIFGNPVRKRIDSGVQNHKYQTTTSVKSEETRKAFPVILYMEILTSSIEIDLQPVP